MKSRNWTTRRRTVAVTSAFAATLLGLSACASGDAETVETSDESEPVTLSYAIWDVNQEPAMQSIADAFTAEHPNVTIEIQVNAFEDYWTKLQTAAAGGAGPDVFWMNGPNFQLYASNGLLAPLDDQGIVPDGLAVFREYLKIR